MKGKAQSAMEYLMTYGWAIIVILVVLAALYILNIFTPNRILGNQCTVNFKYSCTDLVLATNGTVSLLLGQNTGTTEYNIAIACTQTKNATGGPLPSTAWVYIDAAGAVKTSYSATSAYLFESGTSLSINNIPCYGPTGSALGSKNYGSGFTGFLWMQHTRMPGTPGGTNPLIISEIASVQATVGAGGTGGGGGSSTTTTVPVENFITGSNSTAGKVQSLPSVVTSGYSLYLCGGATGDNITNASNGKYNLVPNWSYDTQDAGLGGPATSIGHYTSGCSSMTYGPDLSVAGIGLNGAPTYSTVVNRSAVNLGRLIFENLSYTVSASNSFVVIIGAAGWFSTPESLAVPSGCTQRQHIEGSDIGESVILTTCQSQAIGTYYVNNSYTCAQCLIQVCRIGADCSPMTTAVYIFPNYTPTGS